MQEACLAEHVTGNMPPKNIKTTKTLLHRGIKMGIWDEMKKSKKRMTLAMNKTRGSMAEQNYATGRTMQGYEVERTGRGSDYKERKVDFLTGRRGPPTYVEVKSGNAHLSELQKKTKKRTSKYREERY